MRFGVLLFLTVIVGAAHADLYRWVDPETGSVKFSNYPPPWYGDEAKRQRAPKVERIPARGDTVARPDAAADSAPDGAKSFEALEAQRKAMLQQMPGIAARGGAQGGVPALQKHLAAFGALSQEIDKLNPAGAAARRAEAETVLQNLIKGLPR